MTRVIFMQRRRAPTLTAALLTAGFLTAVTASARAADVGELTLGRAIFVSPSGEAFEAPITEPYPIVQWFSRMNKKGDGRVDIDEFHADALHVFDALDRNHDGILDSGEIRGYEGYLVPIVTRTNSEAELQQDESKLTPNQGAAYYSLFQEPEPVTAADRNFDFKVSRQEFLDQADRHFQALDKGGKGYITLDDLPKTAAEKDGRAVRVAKTAPAGAKPAAATPTKGN